MDKKVVDKWFTQYPDLVKFIDAGIISLKSARMILDTNRYIVEEMYNELLVAGAIRGAGHAQWRATPELKEYVTQYRKEVLGDDA